MEEYKVLITTSGLGSRLGNLTSYTNKSLVRVGDKPAISYIVESYPKNTNLVITLGHYGDHVREFLEIAHADRDFTFVEVENYAGEGSSLLHSMNCARDHLQCPFIFHAADAIILDEIQPPNKNWIAGAKISSADSYRTLTTIKNNILSRINEKGEILFDFAYPGLVGINDYGRFWKILKEILNTSNNKQSSDCHVIQKMIDEYDEEFKIIEIFKWNDIGEPSALKAAKKNIKSSIDVLDKLEENIYLINNSVVKFFYDKEIISKRVKRTKILEGLVPKITDFRSNFFKYDYVEGELFSKSVTPSSMSSFLDWSSRNMWSKGHNVEISNECKKFYIDKTISRAGKFLKNRKDIAEIINGELIPPIFDLLDVIDDEWLSRGISSIIHGDLILDNIIETNSGFCLIDWRQDFAGRLDIGDIYYDLSKLNHNLIFNHEIVNKENYSIEFKNKEMTCDILCSKNLLDCKDVLYSFIESNSFDLEKVQLLTALIWINMAPLHENTLDKFLFNFGKYNLFRALKKRGDL